MPVMMRACRRARGAGGTLLALLLVGCAPGANGGNLTGRWDWSSDVPDPIIKLECSSSGVVESGVHYLEDVDIPPFNRTEMQLMLPDTNATTMCAKLKLAPSVLPRGSFADVLAAVQYPVAELQELQLDELSPTYSLTPRAEHFSGLHLRKLDIIIYVISMNMTQLNPDIFSSLVELRELVIEGATLPPMPTTSRLRTVTLRWGRSTGGWGGCAELRELTLYKWEVPAAGEGQDEGWLAHCPQLSTVRAEWVPPSSLERVLRGARALTSLEIKNGPELSPMQLESMLSRLQLQQLTLPYDMFKPMSENTSFTSLQKLTLDWARLSSDEEENQRVVRRLARLPALQDLTLTDSYGFDFCKLFSENGSLPALRRLTLDLTSTSKICFNGWESLEYLDLGGSYIRELELMQLPPARAHPLLVDMRRTPSPWRVLDFPLDEAGYNLLRDRFNDGANVTVLGDIYLNCDCEHAWVARALRTLPLSMPGVHCQDLNNASLSVVPAERLECSRFECGQCACRRAWRDNATAATCGSDATQTRINNSLFIYSLTIYILYKLHITF